MPWSLEYVKLEADADLISLLELQKTFFINKMAPAQTVLTWKDEVEAKLTIKDLFDAILEQWWLFDNSQSLPFAENGRAVFEEGCRSRLRALLNTWVSVYWFSYTNM